MSSAELSSPAATLKEQTASAHQRTEKALVSRIKAISGPDDYCSLLACMYGYFAPIEQALNPVLEGLFPDNETRRTSGRLLNDIKVLDPAFPLRLAEPGITSPTAAIALGYAYVMEGSVLGGAFIKKMIAGRFPQIPESAFSFFSGYGNENRNMWNAFLDVLNRELAPADVMAEGLSGAAACFSGMESWINAWYAV